MSDRRAEAFGDLQKVVTETIRETRGMIQAHVYLMSLGNPPADIEPLRIRLWSLIPLGEFADSWPDPDPAHWEEYLRRRARLSLLE